MTRTIQDLERIQVEKLDDATGAVLQGILDDYNNSKSKTIFLEVTQSQMGDVYAMVEENYPEALEAEVKPSNPIPQKKAKPKAKSTPKATPQDSKTKKETLEKIEERTLDLENCIQLIAELKKEKREAQGPRPKPNRFTKLSGKLLAFLGLIPEDKKDDVAVLTKTEKILKKAATDLMVLWGMDGVSKDKVLDAVTEKIETMEEKLERVRKNQVLKRWKSFFRELKERIIGEARTQGSFALQTAQKEMLNMEHAMSKYVEDTSYTFDFLKKNFEKNDLKSLLPESIQKEMKLKK